MVIIKKISNMKKIKLYFSAVITAGLMLFTACEQEAIDPLTGKYPVPENYALSSLLSQDVVKGATIRTFTLEFGDTGQRLSVEFVGSRLSYFLPPNAYTIANRADAKAGNYVAGDAEGGTYWVASGSKLKLTDGTIFVTLNGDTYTISGTVMLENESIIKFAFTGAIVFEPDPPAFTYTLEVTKPYAWTTDGTTFNPVEGSQLNRITVLSDGIQVAYFEIVTAEAPASYAGTYPFSGMITDVNGAVVAGVYMDLSAYVPGLIIEGGSHLLDDSDKQYISAGNITIADNGGGALTFTSDNLSIIDKATGQPKPGVRSINYQEATREAAPIPMNNLLSASATDLAAATGGALTGYTVTLKLGEAGLTATPNGYGGLDIGGTGKYVSIDFKRDAATLPAGTYNIKADAEAAVGDAIAGYYLEIAPGFGFNSGCLWVSVDNNVPTETFITGGTVVVAESGGIYTITVNATTAGEPVKAVYTGPITIQ
jgi:hypothetical protein